MEKAGDRGVVEHVGHVLVQQLLAPRVAGVELHGVVPQLLRGSRNHCRLLPGNNLVASHLFHK
jgi:hypothetical protein